MGEVPEDHTAPAQSLGDAGVHEAPVSNAVPHVVYSPPPASRADSARQQKALRRVTRQRKAHPWVKKFARPPLEVLRFLVRHDPHYGENPERWQEQQRKDYGDHFQSS